MMKKLHRIFFLAIVGLLICGLKASGQTLPPFAHVVIVALENNGYSSVVGSSTIPYVYSLIAKYRLATHYDAETRPSIGNSVTCTPGHLLRSDDGQAPASFHVTRDE